MYENMWSGPHSISSRTRREPSSSSSSPSSTSTPPPSTSPPPRGRGDSGGGDSGGGGGGGSRNGAGGAGCGGGGQLKCIFIRYRKLLISTLFLSRQETVLFLCSVVCFVMVASGPVPVGANIDCFKCASLNGDNPSCEDPFHNNFSAATLESPCMGGRKGRDGLFPATACIKMAGVFVETGETITVRGCALDSGTLNTDTEIIRMSHCGHFFFEDRYVKGCLKSCEDSDGCNPSARPRAWDQLVVAIPLQLLATFHLLHTFFSIRTQLL
ncbi:uncharacterized protein LOC110845724 [Folsomia candida]|uniref:uncharacterized protein LOC110845724 n=1 Tax=Folsomia candida TaxID=158441 RepID=UPI001604B7CB|nr:uncharacterized protein LOC110845724 [Folsomia candida]